MTSFTAIFGAYDRPQPAPAGKAVLFTDTQPHSDVGWDPVIVPAPHPDNLARSNRSFKLQPHAFFQTDRVLYLDGRLRLLVPPTELLRACQQFAGGDHDVFLPSHSLGHTVAREFEWVREKRITQDETLDAQAARYEEAGLPFDLPTCQAGVYIARINERTRAFFSAWWSEVREYSHRDQLSYAFAARATDVDARLIPYAYMRERFRGVAHTRPQLQGAA